MCRQVMSWVARSGSWLLWASMCSAIQLAISHSCLADARSIELYG
jgi:hypothetical protein